MLVASNRMVMGRTETNGRRSQTSGSGSHQSKGHSESQIGGSSTPAVKASLDFSDYSSESIAAVRLPDEPLSAREAVELLSRIHREMAAVQDYMLRLRWCMGIVVHHTDRPRGTAKAVIRSIIDSLWQEYGIRANRSLLYECEKLYVVFSGRFDAFTVWVDQQKIRLGRPLTWGDLQELCLGGRNNPDVIGRDDADQRDYRDAEKGIEAIERILLRAREGEEEAIGVIEGIRQSIAGMLILASAMPGTPRCEEYVEFVRSHPCIVCARPSESHHAFGRRGVSVKPSDFTCVPLCHAHHDELHRSGRVSFEQFHRVNLVEVAFNLLHNFLTGTWVSLALDKRAEG